MKKTILECDIKNREHSGHINTRTYPVIFDHDQEDGKTKTAPYLEDVTIEICDGCKAFMLGERKYIYGYGAMGHNTYTL